MAEQAEPHPGPGSAMIDRTFVATLAGYNAEMNRRLYAAALRLSDAERRRERGAFWGSIHGTLCHLLWGDRMWMARFDGWEPPSAPLAGSAVLIAGFDALHAARIAADAGICEWAARMSPSWLAGRMNWYSGAAGREISSPVALLVTHFFNHQTHHRGQAHALITAAGERIGDTDLVLVVEPPPAATPTPAAPSPAPPV